MQMFLWWVITKDSPFISNTNDTDITACLLNQNMLWGAFNNIYLMQKKNSNPLYIYKS